MDTGKQANVWDNRIVGYSEEDPADLLANPYNWRVHSALQQEFMTGVLDDIGFIKPVIVNRVTKHVVDGHMRILLSIDRPGQLVPVIWVELSEAEESIALTTLDSIPDYAGTDKEKLRLLLHRCSSARSERTVKLLGQISESNRLFKLDSRTGEEVAAAPAPPRDGSDLAAAPQGGGESADAPGILQKIHVPKGSRHFTIIWDDTEQEARWVLFTQRLAASYPDQPSLGARLDLYLTEQGVTLS